MINSTDLGESLTFPPGSESHVSIIIECHIHLGDPLTLNLAGYNFNMSALINDFHIILSCTLGSLEVVRWQLLNCNLVLKYRKRKKSC